MTGFSRFPPFRSYKKCVKEYRRPSIWRWLSLIQQIVRQMIVQRHVCVSEFRFIQLARFVLKRDIRTSRLSKIACKICTVRILNGPYTSKTISITNKILVTRTIIRYCFHLYAARSDCISTAHTYSDVNSNVRNRVSATWPFFYFTSSAPLTPG